MTDRDALRKEKGCSAFCRKTEREAERENRSNIPIWQSDKG
jgi:hypothetical protein